MLKYPSIHIWTTMGNSKMWSNAPNEAPGLRTLPTLRRPRGLLRQSSEGPKPRTECGAAQWEAQRVWCWALVKYTYNIYYIYIYQPISRAEAGIWGLDGFGYLFKNIVDRTVGQWQTERLESNKNNDTVVQNGFLPWGTLLCNPSGKQQRLFLE